MDNKLRRLSILVVYMSMVLIQFPYAQNLVPNPGFENIRIRPCHVPTQLPGEPTFTSVATYVTDWYTPTLGTSDVIYSDTLEICSASLARTGVEHMYGGKMCVGIFLSAGRFLTNEDYKPEDRVEYREYIQTKLSSPLKVGKVYRVEFYVHGLPDASYLSNNMGALFTTDSLISMNVFGERLKARPQVIEKRVIKNIPEWQKVSGCFVADSAYRFLTLGNFLSDYETVFESATWNTSQGAYYLIDEVSITETAIAAMPPVSFLGQDTTLCQGQSITYSSTPYDPWLFQRGNTTFTSRTIDQSGTYVAQLGYDGCVVTDTVNITVVPPVSLGSDTLICDADHFEIRSNVPVTWPDGSEGMQYVVNASGEYRVKSVSDVCPSSATINIELLSCPGEIPNAFSPNGDGVNDYFVIRNLHTSEWELQIFNRWGKRVYRNKAYDSSWDGGNLPVGHYFYLLKSKSLRKELKGWVAILK